MLNRLADLVRLRAFANSLTPPVGRANFDATRALALGESVRAQIEAALPDGTYRVNIRNQSLLLRLPFAARAGDILELKVTAREPQLQFAVAAPSAGEQPPSLSNAARFITALLAETSKLPVATTAQAGQPLLSSPLAERAAIAAELHDALTTSGMFYESHQAEWAAGARPLTVLLKEPQAQLPSLDPAAANPAGADDAAPRLPELPVHRDALSIVRQQLDALETREIVWNGLIWHDQPLEWEVSGQQRRAGAPRQAESWRTRLILTLPRLGAIEATLMVAPRGIAIALRAARGDAVAALDEHRGELRQALRDAQLTPLGITVVHPDESA